MEMNAFCQRTEGQPTTMGGGSSSRVTQPPPLSAARGGSGSFLELGDGVPALVALALRFSFWCTDERMRWKATSSLQDGSNGAASAAVPRRDPRDDTHMVTDATSAPPRHARLPSALFGSETAAAWPSNTRTAGAVTSVDVNPSLAPSPPSAFASRLVAFASSCIRAWIPPALTVPRGGSSSSSPSTPLDLTALALRLVNTMSRFGHIPQDDGVLRAWAAATTRRRRCGASAGGAEQTLYGGEADAPAATPRRPLAVLYGQVQHSLVGILNASSRLWTLMGGGDPSELNHRNGGATVKSERRDAAAGRLSTEHFTPSASCRAVASAAPSWLRDHLAADMEPPEARGTTASHQGGAAVPPPVLNSVLAQTLFHPSSALLKLTDAGGDVGASGGVVARGGGDGIALAATEDPQRRQSTAALFTASLPDAPAVIGTTTMPLEDSVAVRWYESMLDAMTLIPESFVARRIVECSRASWAAAQQLAAAVGPGGAAASPGSLILQRRSSTAAAADRHRRLRRDVASGNGGALKGMSDAPFGNPQPSFDSSGSSFSSSMLEDPDDPDQDDDDGDGRSIRDAADFATTPTAASGSAAFHLLDTSGRRPTMAEMTGSGGTSRRMTRRQFFVARSTQRLARHLFTSLLLRWFPARCAASGVIVVDGLASLAALEGAPTSEYPLYPFPSPTNAATSNDGENPMPTIRRGGGARSSWRSSTTMRKTTMGRGMIEEATSAAKPAAVVAAHRVMLGVARHQGNLVVAIGDIVRWSRTARRDLFDAGPTPVASLVELVKQYDSRVVASRLEQERDRHRRDRRRRALAVARRRQRRTLPRDGNNATDNKGVVVDETEEGGTAADRCDDADEMDSLSSGGSEEEWMRHYWDGEDDENDDADAEDTDEGGEDANRRGRSPQLPSAPSGHYGGTQRPPPRRSDPPPWSVCLERHDMNDDLTAFLTPHVHHAILENTSDDPPYRRPAGLMDALPERGDEATSRPIRNHDDVSVGGEEEDEEMSNTNRSSPSDVTPHQLLDRALACRSELWTSTIVPSLQRRTLLGSFVTFFGHHYLMGPGGTLDGARDEADVHPETFESRSAEMELERLLGCGGGGAKERGALPHQGSRKGRRESLRSPPPSARYDAAGGKRPVTTTTNIADLLCGADAALSVGFLAAYGKSPAARRDASPRGRRRSLRDLVATEAEDAARAADSLAVQPPRRNSSSSSCIPIDAGDERSDDDGRACDVVSVGMDALSTAWSFASLHPSRVLPFIHTVGTWLSAVFTWPLVGAASLSVADVARHGDVAYLARCMRFQNCNVLVVVAGGGDETVSALDVEQQPLSPSMIVAETQIHEAAPHEPPKPGGTPWWQSDSTTVEPLTLPTGAQLAAAFLGQAKFMRIVTCSMLRKLTQTLMLTLQRERQDGVDEARRRSRFEEADKRRGGSGGAVGTSPSLSWLQRCAVRRYRHQRSLLLCLLDTLSTLQLCETMLTHAGDPIPWFGAGAGTASSAAASSASSRLRAVPPTEGSSTTTHHNAAGMDAVSGTEDDEDDDGGGGGGSSGGDGLHRAGSHSSFGESLALLSNVYGLLNATTESSNGSKNDERRGGGTDDGCAVTERTARRCSDAVLRHLDATGSTTSSAWLSMEQQRECVMWHGLCREVAMEAAVAATARQVARTASHMLDLLSMIVQL